jgi:hypothetical protein
MSLSRGSLVKNLPFGGCGAMRPGGTPRPPHRCTTAMVDPHQAALVAAATPSPTGLYRYVFHPIFGQAVSQ